MELKKDIERALKDVEQRKVREARAAVEAAAKDAGFTLKELMEKAGGSISAPKYKHPENPDVTWTGRGRKPKWVIAALEAGGSLEDLEI